MLLASGKAYRCFCTAERLAKLRDPAAGREEEPRATTGTAASSIRPTAPAAPRPARPTSCAWRCRSSGDDRGPGSAARRVTIDDATGRRPGAAQVGRLADLPPRQRRRRSPDGDHPRDPRRGVDLLDAEARAAVPGVRLGAAGVLSTCRCCATPTSRRSPSARTRSRSTTTGTPASCPQALLNFLGTHGLVVRRRPREVHAGRDGRRVRVGPGLARRAGVRPRQADVAQREVHPRRCQLRAARRRGDRVAAVSSGLPGQARCRWCASASRGSTSVVPAVEYFFSGDLDYAPGARRA